MMTVPSSPTTRGVQMTPCLRRVLSLPRRAWSDEDAKDLARQLTEILRTPQGEMTLRPVQAIALAEAATQKGAFCPMRVGSGKTLVTLLLPIVCSARRPILFLPAKLAAKTRREMSRYARHWRIATNLRIESYELLGRVQAAAMLDAYQPDLVILDECHRGKNRKAAVTRRLMRYLEGAGSVARVVAMSGTITRRSMHDYAHLLRRALGPDAAPIPKGWRETEEWAAALDEMKQQRPIDVGALRRLCDEETHDRDGVRRAFRKRLVETPGVVATEERFEGASLSIAPMRLAPPENVAAALLRLRAAWELPDGTPLADGLAVWRHARELALGFFYRWSPDAPQAWMAARREWCSTCREILSNNRRNLDSELQVAHAVRDGHYPAARDAYDAWLAVRDAYEPNTVAVWLDDFAIDAAAAWATEPGIVWVEHNAFGRRLAQRTGLPYYGPQGRDVKTGLEIPEQGDALCGVGPVIASIKSNSEGRNLQGWSRSLVTSPLASGAAWEQLLGRTHRDGQSADEVEYHYLVTCREHDEALEQAKKDAEYIEAVTGQEQKLNWADIE